MSHIPVLLNEVIAYLDPKSGENFIDCTVGLGGHALGILERTAPEGKVLGIDWDAESLKNIKSQISNSKSGERLILTQGNFADIEKIIGQCAFGPVHGVLMDLGFSSWHLEESGRGFSFQRNEMLDMRLSQDAGLPTAADMVNGAPEHELERVLRMFGEERFSRPIAREIVTRRRQRRITQTQELVDAVLAGVPKRFHRARVHPATKTFQAIRIAVNHELENLEKGLSGGLAVLGQGGRLAAISFHSLEDRAVKQFMRGQAKAGTLRMLAKKPLTPSRDEIYTNPRARSAKLRTAIKI